MTLSKKQKRKLKKKMIPIVKSQWVLMQKDLEGIEKKKKD